jgi:hypothetical protein
MYYRAAEAPVTGAGVSQYGLRDSRGVSPEKAAPEWGMFLKKPHSLRCLFCGPVAAFPSLDSDLQPMRRPRAGASAFAGRPISGITEGFRPRVEDLFERIVGKVREVDHPSG